MSKYLTEVIGTFFLVLTIGLCVIAKFDAAPLAIGAALMVMVFMGGHTSGAHYNPAVTLAIFLRGRLPAAEVLPYWISQLIGAVLAAFTAYVITGQTFAPAPGTGVSTLAALLVELLFTFALALVVLNVATSRKTEGNSHYGLAIGATVMAAAFAGGAISGGAFNPAVGIGPALVRLVIAQGPIWHTWLYVVGPFAGAILAVIAFKAQRAD